MGLIKVVGKAKREVEQDQMEITITFTSRTKDTSSSISKLTDECEIFLQKWKDSPYSKIDFMLKDEEIEPTDYYDKSPRVTSKRSLYVDIPYDGSIRSFIYKVIEDNELAVSVKFNYYSSKMDEVKKELLAEAVLDSKNRAEILASSTNQKVVEIEKITTKDYNDSYYSDDSKTYNVKDLLLECDSYGLIDEIDLKTITLEEEVYVDWVIQ